MSGGGDGRRPKANTNLQELSGGYFRRVVRNHERRVSEPQPSRSPPPPSPPLPPPPPPHPAQPPPVARLTPGARLQQTTAPKRNAASSRPHASSSSPGSSARSAKSVARPSPPSSASHSFQCGSCSQTFKEQVQLRIHRGEWHGTRHQCNICHQRFGAIGILKIHLANEHGIRPPSPCRACQILADLPIRTRAPSNLPRHTCTSN